MQRQHPPQENLEIFAMLYCIETALRELIIEILSTIEGPKWYKKCLPSDVLPKYKEAREKEKRIPWVQCIPHHPIYYVDFPDLKKIIEDGNNWKKAFERVFARKEVLSSSLSELEPIRNKIAHNRKASGEDVEIVRGVYSKLSTAIGPDYFNSLSDRCTLGEDITVRLTQLWTEAKSSLLICQEFRSLDGLKVWDLVRDKWWFDELYLCEKLDNIISFFQLIDEYSHLPRLRGSGHKIEAWVKSSGVETKYANAQAQFDAILANRRY